MYSSEDFTVIGKRLKKYLFIYIPLSLVALGAFAASCILRYEWLVYVSAAVLCMINVFMWANYLLPCIRYNRFLKDMKEGLTREVTGKIVDIAQETDLQDGVRVLPVRILLEDENDERIIYLNESKKDLFPKTGARVLCRCFGRHIREAAIV